MDAKRRANVEKIAVVVLLAVFGVTLVHSLKRSGILSRPSTPPQHPQAVESSPSPAAVPPVETVAESGYHASSLRDPLQSLLPEDSELMQPSATAGLPEVQDIPARPSTLVVQGIVWGGPQPQAIINDQVYRVGDVVEGAVVTAIGRDGVTIEVDGQSFQLAPKPPASEQAFQRPARVPTTPPPTFVPGGSQY